jgi:hypothetical protein
VYWAGVVSNFVSTGIGIALANAIGFPAVNRYRAWKMDPARIRVCRRNWRGEYVPDLAVIRSERALWTLLALVVLFGLACDFVIMSG